MLFYAVYVVGECLLVEQIAFLALARGVAYHAGGPADERNGLVPGLLQVAEHHNAAQVAYMQGVGRGVDAQVCRYLFFLEKFFSAGHNLVEHTPPLYFFNEIHRCV